MVYAISPGMGSAGLPALRAAAAAGVDFIQIREKHLDLAALREFCRQAREAVDGTMAKLLLNDRLDLALAEGLDGVHLPERGLPPKRIRARAPEGFLIARSCHSQAEVAASMGADFCVLGPIFSTPFKDAYGPPLGLEVLAEAAHGPLPVLALGGINLTNAAPCVRHGAAGVAGIRLFLGDPAAVVSAVHALAGTNPGWPA